MIDRILPQTSLEPTSKPAQANTPVRGKSFSDTLAQASSQIRQKPINAPEGETWKPVKGHSNYVEIASGPRKGQFLNLTRGVRRGEAFTIEEADGKKFHVYGSGDDALRVEVKDRPERAASRGEIPKREVWEPVEGHNFRADILNGPRNGWFVNISGGVRHGEIFHIVKRGEKTFHVYGKGDDKLWVEIRKRPEPAPDAGEGAATDAASGNGPSGGVRAPDATERADS